MSSSKTHNAPGLVVSDPAEFKGPLFLVGMNRSGTKLLRDLLNQNPEIGIPVSESHFIPYLVQTFKTTDDFEDDAVFRRLYDALCDTNFCWNMRRQGVEMSWERFRSMDDRTSWAAIFADVFRYYAPAGRGPNFVWGDKSPVYLNHMAELKQIFPTARFIHILRDPRDYCVSVKKAWGKSIYRAANDWCRSVLAASAVGKTLGADYREVKYESLLANPADVLRGICDFTGCQYSDAMTRVRPDTENLGDAKGQARVVGENHHKYLKQLSARQIRRIEELTAPAAAMVGYDYPSPVHYRPLSRHAAALHTIHDAFASARFHAAEKGVRKGLAYVWRYHRQSGWVSSLLDSVRRIVGRETDRESGERAAI